ncbi:MAG: phosphoribosylamine--glycine ligase [Fimbriimonas sp.]
MMVKSVLIVGVGAREHALVWKLCQECETVYCTPGNPGIAQIVTCFDVKASDFAAIIALVKEHDIELVVVGPEDPLVDGLADSLRAEGILCYGPGAAGAELEGSKAFAKRLMLQAGVPTARFASFAEAKLAQEFASDLCSSGNGIVVKASGNALGKGVRVCADQDEAFEVINDMLVRRIYGEAGATIVVEERLYGPEFSLLTICGDQNFHSLPVAQDYKRAYDGDRGPNTGGMGSISPAGWVTPELIARTEETVVAPILAALREQGISFRGTLFSGLLVQNGNPYCLEYNVRFGDPETQSVMRRLGSGFLRALTQAASGDLIEPVEVSEEACVSVVLASGGYPGPFERGLPMAISAPTKDSGVVVFHAGTRLEGGQVVTNGGRVVTISATAPTPAEARERAYAGIDLVQFADREYRTDIGR